MRPRRETLPRWAAVRGLAGLCGVSVVADVLFGIWTGVHWSGVDPLPAAGAWCASLSGAGLVGTLIGAIGLWTWSRDLRRRATR